MKRILVPIGCRSDEGLSKPIIKRLKEDPFFDVQTRYWHNIAGNFFKILQDMKTIFSLYEKPDLVFITGDRIEMTVCAFYCFHHHIPIAHYFAGIVNYPLSTFDDINRHCITLWSNIQFCESNKSTTVVQNLFNSIKIGSRANFHIVGITHLDDLEIDESLVPEEPYDLILYNPTTLKEDKNITIKQQRKHIVIGKNPDPIIFKDIIRSPTYENLLRPQFLGLLKNCKRFISNSSSTIYEAPEFLSPHQIVQIGDRNKNRDKGPFEKGASDKIVKILKEYLKCLEEDGLNPK